MCVCTHIWDVGVFWVKAELHKSLIFLFCIFSFDMTAVWQILNTEAYLFNPLLLLYFCHRKTEGDPFNSFFSFIRPLIHADKEQYLHLPVTPISELVARLSISFYPFFTSTYVQEINTHAYFVHMHAHYILLYTHINTLYICIHACIYHGSLEVTLCLHACDSLSHIMLFGRRSLCTRLTRVAV